MPVVDLELLDYYIAHAPADPQPWFQPVMEAAPAAVEMPRDMTQGERDEYYRWVDGYADVQGMKCPRVIAYAVAVEARQKRAAAWDAEYEKQRYVQWPLAWAKEMLKAREQP